MLHEGGRAMMLNEIMKNRSYSSQRPIQTPRECAANRSRGQGKRQDPNYFGHGTDQLALFSS